ncbi:MAG: hypothetical protein A2020_02005 [Lentisphaerae bacterium GWF2_45_14]|nr:MAG: hypothetical protein A2020_02005 [Lentisphaerae bacterium GWF2_45_14]
MTENEIILFRQITEEEQIVSEVYMKFSEIFPEDRDFWWRLAMEEKAHASIGKSIQEIFAPMKLYPKTLLSESVDNLRKCIDEKKALLETLEKNPLALTREQALAAAIKIEDSDVEKIFQEIMEKIPETREDKLFQRLNKDTSDHIKKLKKYAAEAGLDISDPATAS